MEVTWERQSFSGSFAAPFWFAPTAGYGEQDGWALAVRLPHNAILECVELSLVARLLLLRESATGQRRWDRWARWILLGWQHRAAGMLCLLPPCLEFLSSFWGSDDTMKVGGVRSVALLRVPEKVLRFLRLGTRPGSVDFADFPW